MEIFSYILSVISSKAAPDLFLAIKNTAGTGGPQYNRTDKFGSFEYWIVPKSKKNREELVAQLKAVPFMQQVSVVQLSKPITQTEITEVRELFAGIGLDTSEASDEVLSFFLGAKLQGKNTYVIDYIREKHGAPEKIRIIRAEEHPHFSPEWLDNDGFEEEILDRELTIDDLEIRSLVLENVVAESSLISPPPPPRSNGQAQE